MQNLIGGFSKLTKKEKTGIVYLMETAINGVYKIGVTEEGNFIEEMIFFGK